MDHKINTSVLAKHLSMDYVLKNFCATSTYMKYLDIRFIKENNSYISVLPYKSNLIGNPDLKVLHGGITVALLEFTAMAQILYGNDNVTSSQGTNLSDNEVDQSKAKVIDLSDITSVSNLTVRSSICLKYSRASFEVEVPKPL